MNLPNAIGLVDADQSDNGAIGLFEARALVVEAARRADPDRIRQAIKDNWLSCEVEYHLNVDGLLAALGITEVADGG